MSSYELIQAHMSSYEPRPSLFLVTPSLLTSPRGITAAPPAFMWIHGLCFEECASFFSTFSEVSGRLFASRRVAWRQFVGVGGAIWLRAFRGECQKTVTDSTKKSLFTGAQAREFFLGRFGSIRDLSTKRPVAEDFHRREFGRHVTTFWTAAVYFDVTYSV